MATMNLFGNEPEDDKEKQARIIGTIIGIILLLLTLIYF